MEFSCKLDTNAWYKWAYMIPNDRTSGARGMVKKGAGAEKLRDMIDECDFDGGHFHGYPDRFRVIHGFWNLNDAVDHKTMIVMGYGDDAVFEETRRRSDT